MYSSISLRLKTIALKINANDVVFDVGSDHGLLPIYLVSNNIVDRVYCCENKLGPFTNLNNNIKKHALDDKIIAFLSDGISSIPKEVNTIVLAGMGGRLIVDILNNNKNALVGINKIITDAHLDIYYLRKEMIALGYDVTDEELLIDKNKYYVVVTFEKSITKKNYLDEELYLGPILLNTLNKLKQ